MDLFQARQYKLSLNVVTQVVDNLQSKSTQQIRRFFMDGLLLTSASNYTCNNFAFESEVVYLIKFIIASCVRLCLVKYLDRTHC